MLWLYNCAFPVVTMEELNSLGFASPMGCFESTSYTMRYRLFAVKEEKLGLRYQSSASIRHPCFLLFPLLEKGKSNIIVIYANFLIVLFANSRYIVTFAPKLHIYDREH